MSQSLLYAHHLCARDVVHASAVGLGLGAVFLAYPLLQSILKYAGAASLIYLAAVIALSGPAKPGQQRGKGPTTFRGAAMFQWINANGWVIVIGTITAYAASARFRLNVAIQTLISQLVGTVSTRVWAFFGTALRPVLTSAASPRLQYRDGDPAARLPLRRLHGCMMPQFSMQKRVSFGRRNALDSPRNPQISPSDTDQRPILAT